MPVNGYPVRTPVFVPYVALEEDPSFLHRSLPFPRAMLCLHPRCERYSSAAITRYTVCDCGRNLGKVLLHKTQRKATQGELFLKKTWRAGITKPKTLFFLLLLRLLALPPFLHVNSRSTEKNEAPPLPHRQSTGVPFLSCLCCEGEGRSSSPPLRHQM